MGGESLNVYWVLPEEPRRSGGPLVALQCAEFIDRSCEALHGELVLTEYGNEHYRKLDSVIDEVNPEQSLFVVTYGPLVPAHIRHIKQHTTSAILYYAQSFGWPQFKSFWGHRYSIPADVNIVANSRYVLAQWNLHATANETAYIPPPLNPCFHLNESERDIDVLLHSRKMSGYTLNTLVPALRAEGISVVQIDDWISQPKLAELLNRAKVFLYACNCFRRCKWNQYPMGEGFGLPPLEALACGCRVACNFLGGVNDFLTPGKNAIKLRGTNPHDDVNAIKNVIRNYRPDPAQANAVVRDYGEATVAREWHELLHAWYADTCTQDR